MAEVVNISDKDKANQIPGVPAAFGKRIKQGTRNRLNMQIRSYGILFIQALPFGKSIPFTGFATLLSPFSARKPLPCHTIV